MSATEQDVLLAVANIESAYGPIKAIRGVSLKVRQGEIATVLGSNGAGKTTILKTISGIIDPRRGSVHFKGEDITANDPAAIVRRFGLKNPIFSETAAYGHFGRDPEKKTVQIGLNGASKKVEVETFTWEKLDAVKDIQKAFGLN